MKCNMAGMRNIFQNKYFRFFLNLLFLKDDHFHNFKSFRAHVLGPIHLPLTDGPSVKCVWYKTIIFSSECNETWWSCSTICGRVGRAFSTNWLLIQGPSQPGRCITWCTNLTSQVRATFKKILYHFSICQ